MYLNNQPLFDEMERQMNKETTHAESFRDTVSQLSEQNLKLRAQEKAAAQAGVDDLLTDLDRSKMATYKRMPEMILKSGEWESFAVCSACKGLIGIKSYCIKMYRSEHQPEQHKCPCCNTKSVAIPLKGENGKYLRNYEQEVLYDIYPIAHQRYRRRYHILRFERKKPWWKFWGTYIAGEGFWEVDHIPHITPLITEPPASNPAEKALMDALAKIEELRDTIRIQSQRKAQDEPPPSPPVKAKRPRSKKVVR